MAKKVLIVTYYWPPAGGGGVQRWVKFVKYLRDYGWEPIVFTADGADYPVLDLSLASEIPLSAEVIKHMIIEPYTLYKLISGKKSKEKIDPNFLSQGKQLNWKDKLAVWVRGNLFIPDARFLWIRPAAKAIDKYLVSHDIDAIISTGPPHSCHLIAKQVAKKHHLPWIVDFRDPWTGIDYFDDLRLSSFALSRHKRLEKSVLDHASCVITVGKTMAADLAKITDSRIEVITNGFDESDRPQQRAITHDGFEISYIGTMNDARNPLGFWQAIANIKQSQPSVYNNIRINLVGAPELIVIQSIERFSISECINYVGYVTHKEALQYLDKAAVLLLIINNTSNNKSILTGKIFEYLMVKKPILCIGPQDGDAADIIHRAQAGVVLDYKAVDSISDFIMQQYQMFVNGSDVRMRGDIEQYSRTSLTQKLATVLNEITHK